VSTYDYRAAHARRASERLAETCETLIKEPLYDSWKKEESGSLAVTGRSK
jgi:hypothetical protein